MSQLESVILDDKNNVCSKTTADFSEKGLVIGRYYTQPGVHPFERVAFERRSSKITEPDGTVVFEMQDVEVPAEWSQLAVDILVSKYFRKTGVPGTGSESSIRQVIHRVVHTIRVQGEQFGVFASSVDADSFEMELSHLLVTQKGAFNSPVWFNCGLFHEYGIGGSGGNWYWNPETSQVEETENAYSHPQCSACFIQSVDDELSSLFDLAKNEAKLFKYGSGSGTNFSKIRGRQEHLSGGGHSSGLMAFLQILDRGAGAIKSGGTHRGAAKMVSLDMDHPEIVDFINWKVREEKKVKVLIDAGYSADFNGEAYKTVSGQNANNSVRLNDAFMEAYLKDGDWQTTFRTTGETFENFKARGLMRQISEAAWACADPGVQFDDRINDWHTCSNTERIYGSNPCSEYHFLDDTACNLASVNLMKFLNDDGSFDVEGYRHACRVFFIAQEILVDFASYPTKEIAQNSHDYRPLGLGYANLGTLLMVLGISYDCEQSLALTSVLTAIMHGEAYLTSAELAATLGSFPAYTQNTLSMIQVMEKHCDAVQQMTQEHCPQYLLDTAKELWDTVLEAGKRYGYRNAQATVLAPTGTIGLLMDCDTTGIEPDFSLVKWKKLGGGGYFKIINQSVPRALKTLGYSLSQSDDILNYILGHGTFEGVPFINKSKLTGLGFADPDIEQAYQAVQQFGMWNEWTPGITPQQLKDKGVAVDQIREIQKYINGTETIEGAPHILDQHLPVFDCANRCGSGKRYIEPMAHIRIMAAAQPFLSGAISKTVNLPNEATVEEIENIYVEAWKAGLKCVALYRDGSKYSQVLNAKSDNAIADDKVTQPLSVTRQGLMVETAIAGQGVSVTTGESDNGQIGEVFIDTSEENPVYRALLHCLSIAVSLGLKYGVPLKVFVDAFAFTRFEPAGLTSHPNIKQCTSVVDFVFRLLGMEYLGQKDFAQVVPESTRKEQIGNNMKPQADEANLDATAILNQLRAEQLQSLMGDAPLCSHCGNVTVRNASCYRCTNCGNSEGCS